MTKTCFDALGYFADRRNHPVFNMPDAIKEQLTALSDNGWVELEQTRDFIENVDSGVYTCYHITPQGLAEHTEHKRIADSDKAILKQGSTGLKIAIASIIVGAIIAFLVR